LTGEGGHFGGVADLRDPNNFGRHWRTVRAGLGGPGVTTHSFGKRVATLIYDEGMSTRIGADHLDRSKMSVTQDRYKTRRRIHGEVANLLDRAVGKTVTQRSRSREIASGVRRARLEPTT
jgi:hypothetical protein